MRLATTVLTLIAVLLAVPCSVVSDVVGGRLDDGFTIIGSPPQPVLQLAQPGKPGHIDWNKTTLQPDATVYILPTTTPRDQNGYIPLYAFQNADTGIYLYSEERKETQVAFDVEMPKYIIYHRFKLIGIGSFEATNIIPQQRVVLYDLPQHSAITSCEEYKYEADRMGFTRSTPPIMF